MENQIETNFLRYCCKDTLSTYLTNEALIPEVMEEGMMPFYNKLVQPLAQTLCKINNGGIKFAYKSRNRVAAILKDEIESEYKQLDKMIGERIPVNPSDELSYFIYEKIGTPVMLRTKSGVPSTSKDAFIDLGKEYPDLEPIFTSIIALRNKIKAVNDFVLNARVLDDGRVYPFFKIGPVSGRLACVAHYEKVTTPNGNIEIKNLKAGDWIYCYDKSNSKTLKLTRVKWVKKTGTRKIIRIHWSSLGGKHKKGTLDVTPDHKVRLTSGEYKEAGKLEYNDRLLSLSKYNIRHNHKVERIEEINLYIDVYDLETESNDHNFIVNEICTHNCNNPNLQQCPDVAKALYIADPGYNFLYADLDQAEICVMAIIADDKVWLGCIAKGEKVHNQNAIDLYGFDNDHKVTFLEKKVAKGFQFGQNYGQGEEGAFDNLKKLVPGLERSRFHEMLDGFYVKHPGLLKYKDNIAIEVSTTKAVKGVFGRTRKLFAPYNKSYRAALNHPMQNGVGDFINKKVITLDKIMPTPDFNEFQARFCSPIRIQIHDAIILMVKEKQTTKCADMFKTLMTQPIPELNGFHFTTEVEVGKRWLDFVHD